MGLDTSTKAVDRRARNHRILGISWPTSKNKPRLLSPEWQFVDGRVRDQVLKAMPTLVSNNCHGMTGGLFFVTPNDDLDGAKPYESDGDVAAAVDAFVVKELARNKETEAEREASLAADRARRNKPV